MSCLLCHLDQPSCDILSLSWGFQVSAVALLILPATPLTSANHQDPAECNSTPQNSPLLMCTSHPHCLKACCQIWNEKTNTPHETLSQISRFLHAHKQNKSETSCTPLRVHCLKLSKCNTMISGGINPHSGNIYWKI